MIEQRLTGSLAALTAGRYSPMCAPSVAAGVLEAAFAVGAAVSVVDLLPGGEACLPLWSELAEALVPRGWHAELGWGEPSPRLIFLPPGKTAADYDGLRCWWLTVESYGNDTVDIHGGRPVPPESDYDADHFPSFSTVRDALEALDG